MKTLDAIDQHMLALLQDNARLPLATIAKRVGLSRSAAQERLRRLETAGAIAGYTIRRGGPDAPVAQAWLAIRLQPGVLCERVVPRLVELPAVRLCHSVAGPIDMWALVEADGNAAIAALRERILRLPGVAAVETTPVLETRIDRR